MKPLLLLCLVFFLAHPVQVTAHSTQGRMKIPLTKDQLDIDDIAYFFESWVHREMYKDTYEKWRNRFYVNEFLEVRNQGNQALVRFRTLDFKEKKKFEDQVTIHRLENGQWVLNVPGKEVMEIYTYVTKTGYYYHRYVFPVCITGLGFGLAALVFLRFRKRGKSPAGPPAPKSTL